MRFLVDADMPRSTVGLTESFGHEATDIRDIGMGRAKDPQIAEYAAKNQLCLITGDWGFSDIRQFPSHLYFGIAVIGLPAQATPSHLLAGVRVLLQRTDLIDHLPGRLVIIEKARV